jgi:multiple sugar transport system substrate-binding protein
MDRRISRRQVLRVLCVGSVGLGIAACAPAPTQAPAASATPIEAGPPPTAAAAKARITHWQHHHEARAAIVQSLVQKFTQEYPDMEVTFESVPYDAYFDKVVTALEAGSGPDVFQIPANIAIEFYNRKQLVAVPEEVMTKGDIEAELVPWTVRLLKFEGEYYGMPTDVQVWPLFINDAMAQEAGLDPKAGPKTWDELAQWALALTKKDDSGNFVQAGLDIAVSPYQYYYQMPAQNCLCMPVDENYNVTYDQDYGIEAWTYITEFVTKHKVDSQEFLAGQERFALGKTAMRVAEYVLAGTLKLTAPDMTFTILPTPYPAGKQPAVMGSSWSYVVSSASKQVQAAWKWVTYITSADSQKLWAAGGGECPSRKSVLADAELRKDPNIATAFDVLPTAIPMDGWGWDDVWYIRQAIWDRVILEGMDVAESVKKGADEERALYTKKFGV